MKKIVSLILGGAISVAAFSQPWVVLPGNDIYYNGGRVGVGHAAPAHQFDVRAISAVSGSRPSAFFLGEQTAASSGNISGIWSNARASHPSGVVPLVIGVSGSAFSSGAGTVTSMRGIQANVVIESGSNVTDGTAILGTFGGSGGGTITNGYGLFISNFPGFVTNKWGVYIQDGNAKNYFGGSVGVGMTPFYPLDVNGGVRGHSLIANAPSAGAIAGHFIGAAGNNSNVVIQGGAGTYRAYWITASNDVLRIGAHGGAEQPTGALNINHLGQVGIGTENTGSFKLAVEGKAAAREIKVTLQNPWPDYVFTKDHPLMPIEELEKFIQQNKHLPNIPSAQSVKENNGIELGDMTTRLLEKVEELTLYVIALKKENDALKKEIQKK